MARKNALALISGSLLDNPKVKADLKRRGDKFALRICPGGGEQINKEFEKEGWPIDFGPLGRKTQNLRQRQRARSILEQHAADMEDLVDDLGIHAWIFIPVVDSEVGKVLSHINKDLLPIFLYNGYDHFFIYTIKANVEQKRRFYAWYWQISRCSLDQRYVPTQFKLDPNDFPEKIEVIGV